MTKSAYIDLEFRSKLVGFDAVESRIDKLINKLNNLTHVSGDIKVSAKEINKAASGLKSASFTQDIKEEVESGIVSGFTTVFEDFTKSIVKSIGTAIETWIPTYYVEDVAKLTGDVDNSIVELKNLLSEGVPLRTQDAEFFEIKEPLQIPESTGDKFLAKSGGPLDQWIPFEYVDDISEATDNIKDTFYDFGNLLSGMVDKGYEDAVFEVLPIERDYEEGFKRSGFFSFNGLEKGIKAFAKLTIGFIGAVPAIKLFTNLVKSIVEQSQVFQSIVQLTLHPFVMMVNFMLLPVLKWLIPHVSEWLEWTVENRDTLESVGTILTSIGDALLVITSTAVPISDFISGITNFNNAISNTDASVFDRFVGGVTAITDTLSKGADNMLLMVNPLGGAISELVKSAIDYAFGDDLFLSISESVKSFFISIFDSIPFIGDTLKDMFGLNSQSETAMLEPVGITKMDASAGPVIGSNMSTPTTDISLLLLESQMGSDNIVSLDNTMSSILRGRMGAW